MAIKKSKARIAPVTVTPTVKKPTVKEQLETLRNTIREYFNHLHYRQPEYTIKLPAKVAVENNLPKDHAVNVPSLIASIVTAQNLNKEVRLRAVQDPTGGALLIEFFTPVTIDGKVSLLS